MQRSENTHVDKLLDLKFLFHDNTPFSIFPACADYTFCHNGAVDAVHVHKAAMVARLLP